MVLKTTDLRKKLHALWNRHKTAAFALVTMLCVSWITTDWADALYILTGTSDSAIVLDGSTSVKKDFSSQLIHLSTGRTGYDVSLTAGQTVTILHNGAQITAQAKAETVSALLSRLHIDLGPLEMVLIDVSGSGAKLTISSELTYYEQVSEAVEHQTIRRPNDQMVKGTEQVVQTGADGVRTAIYEVVWSGGELVSRQFVEEVDSTAVDEIVEYGTATTATTVTAEDQLVNVTKNADGSGVLTFQSGATMSFSSAKSMTATAYTAGHGGADYTTATGTFVRKGVVAVDKNVIPLGTKMYIVTNDGIVYGPAVAEDTGVRGNKVDLYYDTYQQCVNFGRRGCTVYILE